MQEELHAILTISVYDVARNETARQHRQELVRIIINNNNNKRIIII